MRFRVEEICHQLHSARPVLAGRRHHDESSYLSNRWLLRVSITGIYRAAWYDAAAHAHAVHNQVRLDCSHCQSSAARHPLRA